MSAAQRLPVLMGTLGFGAAVVAAVTVPSVRDVAARYLGISAPGGFWRILAITFALINVKTLPFAWHVCSYYLISENASIPELLRSASYTLIFMSPNMVTC